MVKTGNSTCVFTSREHSLTPETVLAKVTEWRHSRLDFWTDAPFHTHEFVEIVFVMEGGGTHQICNGEELFSMRLTKGDVLFINPGDLHTYLFANSEEYLVVKNLIIVPSLLEGGYLYQYAQMGEKRLFLQQSPDASYRPHGQLPASAGGGAAGGFRFSRNH